MPKRLLELFCGRNHSVGKVFQQAGWDVVSVDNDKHTNATHVVDILQFDYKQYEPNTFFYIHASPPCTEYSIAKTRGVRKLELADSLVAKTREILAYFKPRFWTIENPYTGLLKTRAVMEGLEFYMVLVCYCMYGSKYKKQTAIWNNIDSWKPRALCCNGNRCESFKDGKHSAHAQKGPSCHLVENMHSTTQLHSIPESLVNEWLCAIERG